MCWQLIAPYQRRELPARCRSPGKNIIMKQRSEMQTKQMTFSSKRMDLHLFNKSPISLDWKIAPISESHRTTDGWADDHNSSFLWNGIEHGCCALQQETFVQPSPLNEGLIRWRRGDATSVFLSTVIINFAANASFWWKLQLSAIHSSMLIDVT